MSDRTVSYPIDRSPDLARIAVQQARKRMIEAAARPLAVKWRAMRRGDRFSTARVGEHRAAMESGRER
jgi:hypothetical protein